jgi:hypothetical protein
MKPSDFRKANPGLSDAALAMAYATHIDPDGARASEALDRWGALLMDPKQPVTVGIDWARPTTQQEQG